MTWKVDGKEYLHERAISTQQTGFSFVAQSRSGLPDPIGGMIWFGVDDTFSAPSTSRSTAASARPSRSRSGSRISSQFSWDSAFWVFN